MSEGIDYQAFLKLPTGVNQEKTKVVLCKSSYRKLDYPEVSFDFLGFTFRPRMSMGSKMGRLLTGFSPAISKKFSKKIRETIRSWKLTSKVCKSINELSSWLNPIIQGWINYYSKFNKTEFRKVVNYLNEKLIRWLRRGILEEQGMRLLSQPKRIQACLLIGRVDISYI